MWILPKQLHTSAFVPDMAALSLDLNESSQLCAQSLFVRSKPSQLRTWLLKWKRDSRTQHLSGRILKPSHGKAFETAWTFFLAVTHASHSAQPESASEPTTRDIFGPTLQAELPFSNHESVSLKTLKDTSRWDSPRLVAIWKSWVTRCRGEYSARLNAVRRTSENACSSWPTATTRDWKDTGDMSQSMIRKDGKKRMDTLGRVVQANHSTTGSRPELWPTPISFDGQVNQSLETWEIRRQKKAEQGINLHRPLPIAVAQEIKKQETWATPTARDAKGAEGRMIRDGTCSDLPSQTEVDQTGKWNRDNGKLNPRWVETLMGLPVGWTMPSCQYPVTIAPTSCASLATE